MKNTTLNTAQSFAGAALVLSALSTAHAAPLTGSGDHLVIDSNTPTNPVMEHWTYSNVVTNVSFDVSWGNDALAPWQGTAHATGPTPAGNGPYGTTRLDFTSMPQGELAAGTFFYFSDLDNGERFTLRAYDSSNNMITNSAWLDDVVGVSGFGSGPGNTPSIFDMPSWDLTNGEYTFNDNHQTINPNIAFSLSSNQAISYLEIDRLWWPGFSLGAPVPTPGSLALLSIGGLVASRRRRG